MTQGHKASSSQRRIEKKDAAFLFALVRMEQKEKIFDASTVFFPSVPPHTQVAHSQPLSPVRIAYQKKETKKVINNKGQKIEAGETHLFAQKVPVRTVLDKVFLEAIKEGSHALKGLVNVGLLLGVRLHPDLGHHHIEDIVAGTVETGIEKSVLLEAVAVEAKEATEVAGQGGYLGDDKLFTVGLDVGENREHTKGCVLLTSGPFDRSHALIVRLCVHNK